VGLRGEIEQGIIPVTRSTQGLGGKERGNWNFSERELYDQMIRSV